MSCGSSSSGCGGSIDTSKRWVTVCRCSGNSDDVNGASCGGGSCGGSNYLGSSCGGGRC